MSSLSLLLLVIGLAYRMWDNDQVRVHSAEQAVQMARAEAGPRVADLPVRVEEEQDFWIVRFGPDVAGRTHSYLVSLWDKRAGLRTSAETFKALSQNLGHRNVLTTFTSYGEVTTHRQAEMMRSLGAAPTSAHPNVDHLMARLEAIIDRRARLTDLAGKPSSTL